jgi:hypothetical protein
MPIAFVGDADRGAVQRLNDVLRVDMDSLVRPNSDLIL